MVWHASIIVNFKSQCLVHRSGFQFSNAAALADHGKRLRDHRARTWLLPLLLLFMHIDSTAETVERYDRWFTGSVTKWPSLA